jgi:hypothetical protein
MRSNMPGSDNKVGFFSGAIELLYRGASAQVHGLIVTRSFGSTVPESTGLFSKACTTT